MKFHIVRNKETLEDILYIYNLTKDELVEQNKHIRVWNKLIPGTKLRIPVITEAVDLEVTDMEPFVEDYYPTLSNQSLDSNKIIDDNFKTISEELKEQNSKSLEIEEDVFNEDAEVKEVNNVDIKKDKEIEDEIEIVHTHSESTYELEKNKDENKTEEIGNVINLKQSLNDKGQPLINNFYPYYLGVYNAPRFVPYPIIYYPIYYPIRPR